jgi:peptidylprolyl isomerase
LNTISSKEHSNLIYGTSIATCMPLEKGSLILLDYTAKIKDTGNVIETTIEEDAKKSGTHDPSHRYEPKLISVGDGWVLKGLDEALLTANEGNKMDVEVSPDKGFGERDPSKIRMIPQRKLGDKADEVSVGDEIEIEKRKGIVRHVGSGRVQLDFNHRFAGRVILYNINVVKKIQTEDDKVKSLTRRWIPLKEDKIKFEMEVPILELVLPEETFLLDGIQIVKGALSNEIFKYVPSITTVRFVEEYASQENVKKDNNNEEQGSKKVEEQGSKKVEEQGSKKVEEQGSK